MGLYRSVLRPLLFCADPESSHRPARRSAELLGHAGLLCAALATRNTPSGDRLPRQVAGLSLRTPLFHEPHRLRWLLSELDALAPTRPLFLKVAPFEATGELETFLATVGPARCVNGFSVNFPACKPPGLATPAATLAAMPGPVAGRPAAAAADCAIAALHHRMDRRRRQLIGSGGVFHAWLTSWPAAPCFQTARQRHR